MTLDESDIVEFFGIFVEHMVLRSADGACSIFDGADAYCFYLMKLCVSVCPYGAVGKSGRRE
jgi:hypothetical protein